MAFGMWGICCQGEEKNDKNQRETWRTGREDKVFRFTAGIASDKDEKMIATPLVTSLAPISIKKPFIGIELALDDSVANDFVSKNSKIIERGYYMEK